MSTFVLPDAAASGLRRPATALIVLAAFVALGADCRALGLRLRPFPNGRYWLRAFTILGLCALALIGVAAVLCWFSEVPIRSQFSSPYEIFWFATGACLLAPLTEELFYRMALCAPLAARIGPSGTILISSIVFGYLHVRWGNFHWLQILAGAIFAWSYLRSGCLWIPILMHSLGNTLVLLVHTALFLFPGLMMNIE